jgi:hypothetical protein
MVIEVKLTKGKTAIIEDTDADIAELKCHADRYGDRYYAVVPGHKKMHRVIMERMLGRPLLRGEMVDHANNDPLDNRRSNLRLANVRQQRTNSKKKCVRKGVQPSSEFKGVVWHRGRWEASKCVNGRWVYRGYFDDEIEAAFAYDRASVQYDGEFALINFPWGVVPPKTSLLAEIAHVEPEKKPLGDRKPKTSRFFGVNLDRSRGKWRARIQIDGRTLHLGYFDDEVEAARNVDRAAIKYFGADAAKPRLNFPIEEYTTTSIVGRTVRDVLSYT